MAKLKKHQRQAGYMHIFYYVPANDPNNEHERRTKRQDDIVNVRKDGDEGWQRVRRIL